MLTAGRTGAVSITGLRKAFGAHAVLRGVGLEVPEGSLTAVLGPSGSGKTTLLRALAGFARPDAGTIAIGGEVVDAPGLHLTPDRRRIGYVPQEGSLFPHLDVAANIGFGLPRKARRARTADLLDLIGMAPLAGRYPHQLSGGQQQRVALARALAPGPALVLLDEPFSSLDAGLRAGVRKDVVDLLKEFAMTAILVTHDQDEALSTADQVVVLREGVVAQCAAPRELYENPADEDLARFVGEANLLPGHRNAGLVHCALGALEPRPAAGGDSAGDDAAGDGSVTVLIRPEQISILPEEAGRADAPADALAGRVVACEYHGHGTLLTVAAEKPADQADSAGSCAEPPRVLVRTGHDGQLPLGTRVHLTVAGRVTVWKGPGG
jgi:iron(III) transport system ATP-binding protein